jgi:methylmalonyl-CoA/ethylmalonyl-CoA epimerase
MFRKIDHLGLATPSLEEGLRVWEEIFGLQATVSETVEEQGVRTAFLQVGETHLELLEPTGPDTPVGRFLERRGPGFHHICFLVDDLAAALRTLEERGMRLVDREPRIGAGGCKVAFLHPASTGGVLVELKEAADEA